MDPTKMLAELGESGDPRYGRQRGAAVEAVTSLAARFIMFLVPPKQTLRATCGKGGGFRRRDHFLSRCSWLGFMLATSKSALRRLP